MNLHFLCCTRGATNTDTKIGRLWILCRYTDRFPPTFSHCLPENLIKVADSDFCTVHFCTVEKTRRVPQPLPALHLSPLSHGEWSRSRVGGVLSDTDIWSNCEEGLSSTGGEGRRIQRQLQIFICRRRHLCILGQSSQRTFLRDLNRHTTVLCSAKIKAPPPVHLFSTTRRQIWPDSFFSATWKKRN